MVKHTVFLSIILFLMLGVPLFAEEADDLLIDVEEAILDESYTRAISMLEDGKLRFPEDYRFSERAGDLYLNRNLYRLALAEYQRARELAPGVPFLLSNIAEAQGYLGRNDEAVNSLEQLLQLLGTEEGTEGRTLRDDSIDDLSWMYFKTHRMEDGITLLQSELSDRFDMYWAHTLGTLYSGTYNLEESRFWYKKSINTALETGDDLFASIAYYNMSLLEFSFYQYENAREFAERSLELRDRAGGNLLIGELDYMAWQLESALEAYRKAESQDETPLSRMDMADFYQRIGYLDEALRFVDQAEGSGDEGWMYRFGLDSLQFGMDLSEIRSSAYLGKANVEALTPRSGIRETIDSWISRIRWRVQGLYQNRRNRALTRQHARNLSEEGNVLDAAWNNAVAHSGYRRPVLRYLEDAREMEMAFTPDAEAWYLLEIGFESGSREMMLQALDRFTPYEGDPRERSLRELVLNGNPRRPDTAGQAALARLYEMNPGGLRQYGLSLPVTVIASGDIPGALPRRVKSLLRESGYRTVDSDYPGPELSVLRIVGEGEGKIRWYLEDPRGIPGASAESDDSIRRGYLTPVLAGIMEGFYRTPLYGASL